MEVVPSLSVSMRVCTNEYLKTIRIEAAGLYRAHSRRNKKAGKLVRTTVSSSRWVGATANAIGQVNDLFPE
jgi:hypothetical protein